MTPSSEVAVISSVAGRGLRLDRQRMVAGRLEAGIEAAEQALAGVVDARSLAMHQLRRPDHVAAHGLADGLVAEADAENGRGRLEAIDQRKADAGWSGVLGPGDSTMPSGARGGDLVEG